MAKQQAVLVIKDKDVKVRKRQAPPSKVEQSKKTYNRKREKRRVPDWETPLLFCPSDRHLLRGTRSKKFYGKRPSTLFTLLKPGRLRRSGCRPLFSPTWRCLPVNAFAPVKICNRAKKLPTPKRREF